MRLVHDCHRVEQLVWGRRYFWLARTSRVVLALFLLYCCCVRAALVDGQGRIALDVESAGLVTVPPPLITGPRSTPLYMCNVSSPAAGAPAAFVTAYASYSRCMTLCGGVCNEYAGTAVCTAAREGGGVDTCRATAIRSRSRRNYGGVEGSVH